jgi:hypothetical protein
MFQSAINEMLQIPASNLKQWVHKVNSTLKTAKHETTVKLSHRPFFSENTIQTTRKATSN